MTLEKAFIFLAPSEKSVLKLLIAAECHFLGFNAMEVSWVKKNKIKKGEAK